MFSGDGVQTDQVGIQTVLLWPCFVNIAVSLTGIKNLEQTGNKNPRYFFRKQTSADDFSGELLAGKYNGITAEGSTKPKF